MLCSGKDAITEIPLGRFDCGKFKNIYSNFGGFVSDVDRFDHHGFNISAKMHLLGG